MEDDYRILIQHSHIELQTTLILVVQTVNLCVSSQVLAFAVSSEMILVCSEALWS